MHPFELTRALVDIESITENERQVGEYLLRHLTTLQARLLAVAMERVRPGGVVVYSTCSIEPEENAEVVRWALSEVAGLVRDVRRNDPPRSAICLTMSMVRLT